MLQGIVSNIYSSPNGNGKRITRVKFQILLLTYTAISQTYGFSPQHLFLSVHIAVGQLSELRKHHQCRQFSRCWMLSMVMISSTLMCGQRLTCYFSEKVLLFHTSIRPTSRYVTACDEFYEAFSHINTAHNKCWIEKAWVWGTIATYAPSSCTHSHITVIKYHLVKYRLIRN